MPSLRQRVSTYFRQLSFIREDRYSSRNLNDVSFITKYLESNVGMVKGPEIYSGKDPTSDIPELCLDDYDTDNSSVNASQTGPDHGFLEIKRSKLHLSAGSDIDFIDTIESSEDFRQLATSTTSALRKQRSQGTISVSSDQNANSNIIINSNRNEDIVHVEPIEKTTLDNLNKKRSDTQQEDELDDVEQQINEISTPVEGIRNWKHSTDDAYGIAVSLYEKNQLTDEHTGSPIADCFGIISRTNSAVLVIADGVNWGENAKLAARAATFGW